MAKRDLLTIADLSRDEIEKIFALAVELKTQLRAGDFPEPLKHQSLGLLFRKSSTRTRVSFEVGIKQLGGHAVVLDAGKMQLGRGEDIEDSAKVLSRYLDAVMIRTYDQEEVADFARHAAIPVINGLTDLCHPCQVLTDIFTLIEHGLTPREMQFVYVGDANNVAYSWLMAAGVLGMKVRFACPEKYSFPSGLADEMAKKASAGGGRAEFTTDPRAAVKGADVVYTDTWISMGQEDEKAERLKAFEGFQVNGALLAHVGRDYRVMHDLPAYKGYEIDAQTMYSPQSIILDQAENRLHLQKGILCFLMKHF